MNAFTYFAEVRREARRAGWSQDRIDAVLKDAMSGDYDHAVETCLSALAEIEFAQA
jgi:hypothetical protein